MGRLWTLEIQAVPIKHQTFGSSPPVQHQVDGGPLLWAIGQIRFGPCLGGLLVLPLCSWLIFT